MGMSGGPLVWVDRQEASRLTLRTERGSGEGGEVCSLE